MFHWICPECGRELPPSVRECPACDPKAPARNAQGQWPLLPAAQPAPGSEPDPAPAALLALAEQVRLAQATCPSSGFAPLTETVSAPQEKPSHSTPNLVEHASALGSTVTPHRTPSAAPAPLAPPPPPCALAPLPKPEIPTLETPVVRLRSTVAEPFAASVASLLPIPLAQIRLAGEPAPPQADMLHSNPLPDLRAAAGRAEPHVADNAPQFTLPGPALPPELASFQEGTAITDIGDPPAKWKVPAWLVSAGVATALLAAAVGVALYLLSARTAATHMAPAAARSSVRTAANPLSKYIELTGFRIVVDFKKKSEVRYLVVNHSAAELADMILHVVVRSPNAPASQPPVCRFSFRLDALAPYESREMTTSIEKLNTTFALPDWQDLRAEFQITAP